MTRREFIKSQLKDAEQVILRVFGLNPTEAATIGLSRYSTGMVRSGNTAEGTQHMTTPELDAAIIAAHPLNTGRHDLYEHAMRLVGARHGKGELVELVNWLLAERDQLAASKQARETTHD